MKVRDLMTSEVHTLSVQDSAAAAHDLMETRRIRHVPIVDRDRELIGLVSQRDLLKNILAEASQLPVSAQGDVLRHVKLGAIMVAEPETIEPDDEITEAGALLLENKFGCLPVVEGTRLVGILTESDFVRYVTENEA